MKNYLMLAAIGLWVVSSVSANEGLAAVCSDEICLPNPTTVTSSVSPILSPLGMGGNAPVLLASLVVDIQSRIPDSDARAWNRVGRPDREPTDPDAIDVSLISRNQNSTRESPWDAWEDRDNLRSDWEALAPDDR